MDFGDVKEFLKGAGKKVVQSVKETVKGSDGYDIII
jgi:hypothetical protein